MLAALEEDGRVDTSRAAVVGGSYGGYMVNAVLALYPDAFDAGASLFGVGNWVTALQVASPGLKASDRIDRAGLLAETFCQFEVAYAVADAWRHIEAGMAQQRHSHTRRPR